MKGILENDAGVLKNIKIGFSWTTLFFGLFVPLIRGDWKWFLIILVADAVTFGLANIVFCFIYNKLYINDLLLKGFEPANEQTRRKLAEKGYIKDVWRTN